MVDFITDLDYNRVMMNKKGNKMDKEIAMYGMSVEDIEDQYLNSITARFSGLEMVVMGILSDCQEMMAMGTGPRSTEYVRKQMNVAKFILCKMQDQKETA